MFKSFEKDDTSLNMNKGRSARRITTRAQQNIETVWQALEKNQGKISVRRNGLRISPTSFCRIIKKDLRCYPYRMIRRHDLKRRWLWETFPFFQWFLHQCNNRTLLANSIIGDQVRLVLNGAENYHKVRIYTLANQPPDLR